MSALTSERVLSVRHWSEGLFSFTTTRSAGLRFRNGHFVMIGLRVEGKPLLRAYSIASPSHAEHLEFLSVKVPHGQLTSRLQHLRPGDEVLVGSKPVGTLVLDDLRPGRHLYLLATGTGLAPFMSIVRDPEVYERFERVVLVHGVRHERELAYAHELSTGLRDDEYLGDMVRERLAYVPACTRDDFRTRGRITDLLASGTVNELCGLPSLSVQHDRAMVCGSVPALADLRALLDARGFVASPGTGEPGDYVFERAFAEK